MKYSLVASPAEEFAMHRWVSEYPFNARSYVDIMYLDGRTVINIVDEATSFSTARFLPNVSTDSVWDTIQM